MKIESRGVRCLGCTQLDLRKHPEHAKLSYGLCLVHTEADVFVRFEMQRNCTEYVPADAGIVKAREDWASKIKLPMWQR